MGLIRFLELAINARHEARLFRRGAVRHPHDGLRPIVAAQIILFVGLFTEGVLLPPEPRLTAWTWVLLAAAAAAVALRHWAIHTLGDHWTIHVMTVPGAALVRRGPYRLLRHPNYLAVAIEGVALPLAFEAYVTAALIVLVGGPALWYRIRQEERALRPFRARSNVSQEAS
ncbi:MAG TPA: isoprenylcysteine carboxylmethyltransferase family protein [Candidatus Thermoplasmatota archaeon]|nr:isoprenylcysteine carboxylmethyltransferase family protein [Candidatus Thermoplasmatota archaeon]